MHESIKYRIYIFSNYVFFAFIHGLKRERVQWKHFYITIGAISLVSGIYIFIGTLFAYFRDTRNWCDCLY